MVLQIHSMFHLHRFLCLLFLKMFQLNINLFVRIHTGEERLQAVNPVPCNNSDNYKQAI